MTKQFSIKLVQILLISGALFFTYYFFYLKPKIQLSNNRIEAEKILAIHKNTLTQNRIAYIGLTRLDPESPVFPSDASTLISTLYTTQKEGLDQIASENIIPKTNIIKTDVFSNLLMKTEDVYKSQKEIVNNIKSSKSYSEGLDIIKSESSITLLTKQTNLILEYQYWLDKIKY